MKVLIFQKIVAVISQNEIGNAMKFTEMQCSDIHPVTKEILQTLEEIIYSLILYLKLSCI